MRYPKGIDKYAWDKMVEFTWQFLTIMLFVAIICIIFAILKGIV